MLGEAYFSTWKNDAGGDVDNPEEMQKKDPLATQVWKLYSKARTQLPNAERMENLTWRMMSMNLRRQHMERKGKITPKPTGAPSGIAQLRQSVDQNPTASNQHSLSQQFSMQASEPMNLDDLIYPSSIASPAGLSPSPSNERSSGSTITTTQGIPIRKANALSDADAFFSRASAPSVPPTIRRDHEFGYVARHVRKTSIDERRVSFTMRSNYSSDHFH